MNRFKMCIGDWQTQQADATFVREQVFILEQQIPADEEWDEMDGQSIHFVVFDDQQAVATARLLSDHHIGRVAVLQSHRGKGLGAYLMQQVIQYAKQEQRPFLVLSAQVYATDFYEKIGFRIQGEEYLDCGIPHVMMSMPLNTGT